jgi:hypothetical protein
MSKGDSGEQRPDVVGLADEEGVKQILTDSILGPTPRKREGYGPAQL